jgi:osmotically-inducible protein OsmY
MWNDTELQHDVEKELGWEPSVHAKQIGVIVKSGAVELGGHVDSFWESVLPSAPLGVWPT